MTDITLSSAFGNGPTTTATATVANGGTTSGEVNCSAAKGGAIRVPSGGLNAVTSLKFLGSTTPGGTFLPLYDEDNVELEINVAAAGSNGGQFSLPPNVFALVNYCKVVTQTNSAQTIYTLVLES